MDFSSRRIMSMPADKELSALTLLKRVPVFSSLSDQELGFLAARLLQRRFSAGELIFGEGQACAGLYVIETGNVRIFKTSVGGREQVLAIEGPGNSIAELPVFDGGNYPASAQAITDCLLVFFSKEDFQALCLKHPQVALKVLRVVGGRLRRLVGIIEELSFTTVRHRLITLLVRAGKAEGNRHGDTVTVTLPANNSELAAQIGTVRELVSRNLSRLQSEGLLQIDNRTVLIPSFRALEAELDNATGAGADPDKR
jgi:CRP-like cAMP-binding protein